MTDLDEIRAILRDVALRQDRTQQQIDANSEAISELRQNQQQHSAWFEEMRQHQERTQQQIDSNARAIQANSEAIAELRRQQQETSTLLHEEIGNLVTMITDLSGNIDRRFEQLSQEFERERVEREALRADVRSLIQALRDRFNGNGQSQER